MEEVGRDAKTGHIRVRVDPKFYRPTEVVSSSLKFSLHNYPTV